MNLSPFTAKRCYLLTVSPKDSGISSRQRSRARGFTLIELLVVITIIAILAALSFPAANGALNAARKAQARNDVQQIVAAVKAFQAEYGRMPTTATPPSGPTDEFSGDAFHDASNNNTVIRILMAQETTALPINAKGIVFLEPKAARNLRKGGVDLSNYVFYDPWGTGYRIKLDNNYSGKIEYYGGGQVNIFNSAMAVSAGPDTKFNDPYAATGTGKDDICSFK